jgi:aspartyl-tRNA(Asn)/glutamyl-tRNA(Gln) amidotransferase subunit C
MNAAFLPQPEFRGSMKITVQDVEYIARLARLEYSDEEKDTFTEQFNVILGYIETLNELDTDGVEPLSHVIELSNVVREDETQSSLPIDLVLKNAPAKSGRYFTVPKVIGGK